MTERNTYRWGGGGEAGRAEVDERGGDDADVCGGCGADEGEEGGDERRLCVAQCALHGHQHAQHHNKQTRTSTAACIALHVDSYAFARIAQISSGSIWKPLMPISMRSGSNRQSGLRRVRARGNRSVGHVPCALEFAGTL